MQWAVFAQWAVFMQWAVLPCSRPFSRAKPREEDTAPFCNPLVIINPPDHARRSSGMSTGPGEIAFARGAVSAVSTLLYCITLSVYRVWPRVCVWPQGQYLTLFNITHLYTCIYCMHTLPTCARSRHTYSRAREYRETTAHRLRAAARCKNTFAKTRCALCLWRTGNYTVVQPGLRGLPRSRSEPQRHHERHGFAIYEEARTLYTASNLAV